MMTGNHKRLQLWEETISNAILRKGLKESNVDTKQQWLLEIRRLNRFRTLWVTNSNNENWLNHGELCGMLALIVSYIFFHYGFYGISMAA